MRIASFILLSILSFCNPTFGQTDEQLVLNIRAEFNRINSLSGLRTIKLRNEEFLEQMTDGGGTLTGFYENNILVKITEQVGLSYGEIVTDYYLKNGKFFFAYQREKKFADKLDESGELIGLDYTNLSTIFEGRYYFNSDELIKKIETGERLFSREFELEQFLNVANETVELLNNEN